MVITTRFHCEINLKLVSNSLVATAEIIVCIIRQVERNMRSMARNRGETQGAGLI